MSEAEDEIYGPKGLQGLFGNTPLVPHDHHELTHVPALLEKIPLYRQKIDELHVEVEKLAGKLSANSWENNHVIQQLIFKSFFADLGNRAFRNIGNNDIDDMILRGKTNLIHEGIIKSRNLGCEVCEENRSTDRCHIIPRKIGGSWDVKNILVLCPTHHRLFDRYMLTRAEYAAINWNEKAKPSQEYADSVIFHAHEKFWARIEKEEHERIAEFDREAIPFVKYVIVEILGLFAEKKSLKRSSIYKAINPELREISKKIVACLVKENVLLKHESGADCYYIVSSLPAEKLDELSRRTWQRVF